MEFERECSLVGQNLTDDGLYCYDWNLASGCTALNLHNNSITKLETLTPCRLQLIELNVSSNRIQCCRLSDNLANLSSLINLDLSANLISDLRDLPYMQGLRVFSVAFNRLSNVSGIDALPNLEELYIQGNMITSSADLDELSALRQLRSLTICSVTVKDSNPVCKEFHSIYRLFGVCPSLQKIDEHPRSVWEEWRKVQDLQQREAFLVNATPAANLTPPTPRVDSLLERFRPSGSSNASRSPRRPAQVPSPSKPSLLFPSTPQPVPPPPPLAASLAEQYNPESEQEDMPYEDSFSSAGTVDKLDRLVAVLSHWQTLTNTKRTARALHHMRMHALIKAHAKKCNEVIIESEKRSLQETQKYSYISKKNIANEILVADLRKQMAVLERKLQDQKDVPLPVPPPPPAGPSQELVEQQAVVQALQAQVRSMEEQAAIHAQTTLAMQISITALNNEVEGLREVLDSKVSALDAAERELTYSKQRLTASDQMTASLQMNVNSMQQALQDTDRVLKEKEEQIRQVSTRLQDNEADLKEYMLMKDRMIYYEQEVRQAKQQLLDANEKLSNYSNHNGKLEERLIILTKAYDDISAMNTHYIAEVDKHKSKCVKYHDTLKELHKCVRKQEGVIASLRGRGCEDCARLRQDVSMQSQVVAQLKDELRTSNGLLDDYRRKLKDYESRDQKYQHSDEIRSQQLNRFEQTIQDIENRREYAEREKLDMLNTLNLKEVIVRDQQQALADVKRKLHALEKDYHALQAEKDHVENKLYYQEQEIHKLQKEVRGKGALEAKLDHMVTEFMQSSDGAADGHQRHKAHQENYEEDDDNVHGIAIRNKRNKDGPCTNRRCQEQMQILEQQLQEAYDKLQKQKQEYDTAYANKVDECRRFGDIMATLDSKTRDFGVTLENDRKQNEEIILRLKSERKQLSKQCKALTAELLQKEEELRNAKEASRALQEACAAFQRNSPMK